MQLLHHISDTFEKGLMPWIWLNEIEGKERLVNCKFCVVSLPRFDLGPLKSSSLSFVFPDMTAKATQDDPGSSNSTFKYLIPVVTGPRKSHSSCVFLRFAMRYNDNICKLKCVYVHKRRWWKTKAWFLWIFQAAFGHFSLIANTMMIISFPFLCVRLLLLYCLPFSVHETRG